MAIIGTFTKTQDGYRGTLKTLNLAVDLEFHSHRKDHEKAPDFRIAAPHGEVGAAWQRTSAAERDYLSVKIDDPVFPAPLYASLVLSDDGEEHLLIWTR